MFGHQFAQELATDDGVADDRLGVEDITFEFDDKFALGFEVAGDGIGDVVAAQVDVAAAAFAHGGLGIERHLQFGAAFETGEFSDLLGPLRGAGGGPEDILDADVLAALLADRGDGGSRLRLLVPAAGADDQDLILFLRWHSRLAPAGASGGSASAQLGRFGHLGNFPGPRRGDCGRDLVGIDLGFADEGDALFNHQFGGPDVSEQFGLGLDFDLFLGADVAVDLAAHHHVGGVDMTVDDGAVAQIQRAVGVDFPIQFAVESQFAGEFDVPFDLNIRVQDVFRRGSRCAPRCAHSRVG